MNDLPSTDTKSAMNVWPGNSYPLGATWDGAGVNFSLFSENAAKVELCLFDNADGAGEIRLPITEQTHQVWHIYLPEARPGQRLLRSREPFVFQARHGHALRRRERHADSAGASRATCVSLRTNLI